MANRICSLCGLLYTDETGHNYDVCVERCKQELYNADTHIGIAENRYHFAKEHLAEAKRIQAQDWWKDRIKEVS